MKTAFALFVVLLSVSLQAYTPPDSCLKLICPNDSIVVWDDEHHYYQRWPPWNPDSVKVDSCTYSSTYEKKYAKRYFNVKFDYTYPFSTVIPVDSIRTTSDMADSTTKAQFQQLEQTYGNFYFVRDPFNTSPDSIYLNAHTVFLLFEQYQYADTILYEILNNIDSVYKCWFIERWLDEMLLASVDTENRQDVFISPNPAGDYIEIPDVVSEVKVYDVLGIEHPATAWHPSKEGNVRIDVSALPKGVYFVSVGGKVLKFLKI